ncbi:MAG: glycosyltransferase [Candidatus Sumerlaeia bacterium]
MHVLIVSREFPPAPGGGIKTYVISIAEGLRARGARVSIISEQINGAADREVLDNDIRVYRIPAFEWANGQVIGFPQETLRLLPEAASLASKCDGEAAWALRVAYKIREIHEWDPIDIIEGQEYEAPLYYFLQLRLAREDFPRIPVVTHMHSPTQLTKFHDEDAPQTRGNAYRKIMEKFCAAASEAVCAPSENLARWTDQWLGVPEGSTAMIRLPLQNLEKIAQDPKDPPPAKPKPEFFTVGRLEMRKGTEVLARAVTRLVSELPELRVNLIGGDTLHLPQNCSLKEWLDRRVLVHAGDAAKRAFNWVGPKPLGELWHSEEVKRSMAFVIPSLWDNSPYTCIEAMAHGHLVIASDNGGQGEMVQDGKSGIVIPAGDVEALSAAMRRVYEMSPEERAEMGREARRRILDICGTEKVVKQRIDFYQDVIDTFKKAECRPAMPHVLPYHDARSIDERPYTRAKESGRISIVVPCFNMGEFVGETLGSLMIGKRLPDEVVVIDDGSTDAHTRDVLGQWQKRDLPFEFQVHRTRNQGLATARIEGAARSTGDYIVFLDADDCVTPEYLHLCASILDRYPEAGVVTAWYEYFGECDPSYWTPLTVQFPLFLMENCVGAGAMLRRDAYDDAGGPKPAMRYNFEDWELWVSVMEKGWAAVTIPQPLFRYRVRAGSMYREMNQTQFCLLRERMMEFHPDLYKRFALDCLQMAESGTGVLVDFSAHDHGQDYDQLRNEVFALREMVGRAKALTRNPLLFFPYAVKKMRGRLSKKR